MLYSTEFCLCSADPKHNLWTTKAIWFILHFSLPRSVSHVWGRWSRTPSDSRRWCVQNADIRILLPRTASERSRKTDTSSGSEFVQSVSVNPEGIKSHSHHKRICSVRFCESRRHQVPFTPQPILFSPFLWIQRASSPIHTRSIFFFQALLRETRLRFWANISTQVNFASSLVNSLRCLKSRTRVLPHMSRTQWTPCLNSNQLVLKPHAIRTNLQKIFSVFHGK